MAAYYAATAYFALVAVCFVLVAASNCHISQGEKPNKPVCGTIGQKIVGRKVSQLQAGFKKCVEACEANISCNAVNYWSLDTTCRLVQTMDSPESPHQVEITNGCLSVYVRPVCLFNTVPSTPFYFAFPVQPMRAPFTLNFTVQAKSDVLVALASEPTMDSVFCMIVLGNGFNQDSSIKPCIGCSAETQLNTPNILRRNAPTPFWITLESGLVEVGKAETALMTLDVTKYGAAPTTAHIGISTWQNFPGNWVIYQFCK